MRQECRKCLSHHRLQRKPLVSDPGIHHGTCVTHVPWCTSGSLTCGGGQNVLGIPGACATRNFMYVAEGQLGCYSWCKWVSLMFNVALGKKLLFGLPRIPVLCATLFHSLTNLVEFMSNIPYIFFNVSFMSTWILLYVFFLFWCSGRHRSRMWSWLLNGRFYQVGSHSWFHLPHFLVFQYQV